MGTHRPRTRAVRGFRIAVLAAATAGLLAAAAGCGGGDELPEGVDGEVTDQWDSLPDPAGFVPDAEVCHQQPFRPVVALDDYHPVGCEQPHRVQTAYVGTFEEDDAQGLEAPPAPDSGAHRAAYRTCDAQAADYLGADYREGRLLLRVALPSAAGWAGGARWFRCDLLEIESVYGEPVERQGSLAGALAEDSSLRLGCFVVEDDDGDVAGMAPAACDEPHDAEFVGVWEASGDTYPEAGSDAESEVYGACRERAAEYVDVPADGDLVYRTGAVADWMSEEEWDAGNRGFRCYLWLPGAEFTESLAGAGPEALPVRTDD